MNRKTFSKQPLRSRKLKKARTFKRGKLKSNLEVRIRKQLLKEADRVGYETTTLSYTIRKNYVPDFTIIQNDGRTIYVETKGYFRQEDRVKMRAVKCDNPSLDIRLVFDKDNKLHSKSQMTYSEWCDKYGFPWAVGSIPKDWFNE